MIALRWSAGIHPPLERIARRVTGVLGAWGLVTADEARADAVVAVGAADPAVLAGGTGAPLVVMPLLGPGPPPPWCAHTLARAGALALLSPAEAAGAARHTRAPAVLLGLPAPAGPRPVPAPASGPAEIVSGRGACAAAEALEAWAAGLPVVAAPPAGADPVLAAGGALRAGGALECGEAQALLRGLPPLARTLPGAGRRAMRRLPAVETVAERLLEAVVLAAGGASDRGSRAA